MKWSKSVEAAITEGRYFPQARASRTSFAEAVATDLEQDERLVMAASYIERALGRISVCAAALTSGSPASPREFHQVALSVAQILEDDLHNDLDVAREIFQTWESEETAKRRPGRVRAAA
jgi:hypothetical protein